MACYSVTERAPGRHGVNGAQHCTTFTAWGSDVVRNIYLHIADGGCESFFDCLALTLHPQLVDILVGQIEQTIRCTAGEFIARKDAGGTIFITNQKPTAVFPFFEQRSSLE